MRKILVIIFVSWSVTTSAQCLQTAPYVQTFNNDTTPTCWTNPVNIVFGTPIYWYSANNTSSNPSAYAPAGLASTIGDHTGNNGFYMYAYRGWNTILQLTSPDIDVSSLTTPALSFWMFAHTTSAQNNLLTVDVYDGTWHPAVATFSQSNPNWTNKIINLSAFAGDTIQVRFRRGSTVNGNQDILIDDFFVGELPTCLPPTSLVVDSVNASQAFIDIAGATANVWEFEYGFSGFALGSGTRDTTSQNTVLLLNLTSNTNYDVYVRNKCSTTDTSVWLQTSFTTLCGVFATPFTETFDVNTTPDCWSNYSTVIPNYLVGFSSAEDHTANNGASATWDYFTATPILHLETPEIDISGLTQPYLSFFRKAESQNNQPLNGFVSTQAWDGANWITLKSFNSSDPNWQYKFIDLTGFNLPDTTSFRLTYQRIGGANVTEDYLDDFTIGEKPICLPTDSMYVNNITANAVAMKFTGVAPRQIEWGVKGFLRGTGNYVSTYTTNAILLGTLPSTNYTAYYRDSCTSGYSEWSDPVHFQTSCLSVFSVPYLQTFNNLPLQDTLFLSACWSAYKVGKTNWIAANNTPSGSTGPDVLHDGQFAYTEASGGDTLDESYLVSPIIDLNGVNNPYLSFYYHMYGNTMGNLCVEIFNGTTWQPLGNCLIGQQQTSANSPWLRKTISLSSYANSTVKVRFKAIRGNDFASDMAIDDVLFMDSCLVSNPIAGFAHSLDSLNLNGYFVSFASSATSASSTTWYFGDGGTDTGLFVVHAYQANGTYTVWQVVQNQCGRVDSVSAFIQISKIGFAENNIILSPIVFPNPAQQYIQLAQLWYDDVKHIVLVNMLGQEVLLLHTTENSATLDVSNLPDGVYMVNITSQKGTFSQKIRVSRQ